MRAVIYNLDGKLLEVFDGDFEDASFKYYTKTSFLKDLPIVNRFAPTEEHTFNCDYVRSYPFDIGSTERISFYKFNGKDYKQMGLDELTYPTTPITITDYITQWKLAQAKKAQMIKDPDVYDVARVFTWLAVIILLVGVGYIAQTSLNATQLQTKTLNATLTQVQLTQATQVNQTHQLYRLYIMLLNKTSGNP